jgi:hypothetical protein
MEPVDGKARGPDGLFSSTADCDCQVCKCDLFLSSVITPSKPDACVCPEHVAALGVPMDQCILLQRCVGIGSGQDCRFLAELVLFVALRTYLDRRSVHAMYI